MAAPPMAGDLQCTLIQRSTCIVLMCYLVTPGFKAAWRSCTNETAVRHLDVDAPLVMDGLAAQEASGMWSRKTVQCSTGAPALLCQRHALSRTCGIILLQEGSPARVFSVSATAESNHQQRRRTTVALRCISHVLSCPQGNSKSETITRGWIGGVHCQKLPESESCKLASECEKCWSAEPEFGKGYKEMLIN